MSIYKINSSLSITTKVSTLSDMILELEGLVGQAKFDKQELDQIYNDITLDRKFLRNQNLGHTLSTYTGWTHHHAETGYSIWKFIPTSYAHNSNNQLYFDDKLLTYKGLANSDTATTFDKVWVYNGSSYIDNTTEAGTENGTEFSIFSTQSGYLYIGLSSTFSGMKFEFQTRGSNYTLEVEYSDDSSGTGFATLTSSVNSLVDNTSNFESDGSITWTIPSDFTSIYINGVSKYWIRISSSTTPVTTAKAYLIIPSNSVIALLAMSSEQLTNEDWLWCSYNGSIYVTVRNSGNQAYEGNYYITSSSSTTNKQNFFVYNHTYSSDYQDSTFVQGAAGWGYFQPPVEDKDVTDPASGLSDGIRYLIINGLSGSEFVGYDNYIAEYDSSGAGSWTFITPTEGMIVYVKDEDNYYYYNGSSWVLLNAGGGVLDWQDSVLDKDLTSVPGSPTEGDRYIVASGSTGAWSFYVNYIAEYIDTAWVYTQPNEGFCTWVEDENKVYIYNGTSWVELSIVLDHGSLLGLTDDDHTQYLLHSGNRALTGNLNANYNRIINLSDPTAARDAATKGYVDEHINIEDLWDRVSGGTTLTPMNANDNLDLGSGNFTTTGTYNLLSLTSLSIGFRISGGTTNKILTLNDDITTSNLVDSSSFPLSISSGNISLLYNSLNFELDSAQQLTIKESGIDHGAITGLGDNDHTQYVKAVGGLPLTLSGQIISFNFDNTDFQLNGNQLQISDGGINHSSLSNLSADSHTQYLNNTRADIWFLNKSISSLNDVDIESGVSLGQLLRYDGSRWHNWTANYLSSESDTLNSVVGRGTTTSIDITIGDLLYLGDGTTGVNKVIYANNGDANLPNIRYNESDNSWEYSNNGTVWTDIGSGGGSTLDSLSDVDVSSGLVDGNLLVYESDISLWTSKSLQSLKIPKYYRTTFVNGNLTAGVLTITHNLGTEAVNVIIRNDQNKKILPDSDAGATSNTATVDLSSYGTLTGTWRAIVIGAL